MIVNIITRDIEFFERLAAAFVRMQHNGITLKIRDRIGKIRTADEILILDKSISGSVEVAAGCSRDDETKVIPDAVITDSACEFENGGIRTLKKYRNVNDLYNDFIELVNTKKRSFLDTSEKCKTVLFCNADGGAGASTVAAAAAMISPNTSFYLNLEKISGENYFSAESKTNLGDVIFAYGSRAGTDLSCLDKLFAKDKSGVGFISSPENETDRAAVDASVCAKICDSLKVNPGLRMIAIDAPFSYDNTFFALFEKADIAVVVSDGRRMSGKARKITGFLSGNDKPVIEIVNRSCERQEDKICIPDFGPAPYGTVIEKVSVFLSDNVPGLTEGSCA